MSKVPASASPDDLASEAIPATLAQAPSDPAPFRHASHDALFEAAAAPGCDACGAPLPEGDDDDGFGVAGAGVYLWTRGDSVRFEQAPLCASCASAIGMTALARWEIEEEEG
jgi:hypothetical protein